MSKPYTSIPGKVTLFTLYYEDNLLGDAMIPYQDIICSVAFNSFLGRNVGYMSAKMNAIWVTLGCILAVVSHIILSIQNLASSLLMLSTIILSLGYSSVASAVWILLGYTTPLEKNAIIYGLAQSFQHVAFIVVSKISGKSGEGKYI